MYRHLCNLFCLPHISTIKRWLNCLQVYPGFDNSLFAILKEACQHLSPENRICAICLDEMSIKSHLNYNFGQDKIEGNENYGLLGSTKLIANYALVFIIRGVKQKWKFAIGYFLSCSCVSGDILMLLLLEAIEKVNNAGFIVKIVFVIKVLTIRE